MLTPLTAHFGALNTSFFAASANIPAIEAAILAIETAHSAGNRTSLQTALSSLTGLVEPLPDAVAMQSQLRRLQSGRSAIPRRGLNIVLRQVREATDSLRAPQETQATRRQAGSGVHGSPNPYLIQIRDGVGYSPRKGQAYIAGRAVEHFSRPNPYDIVPKRGIFRMDTGMGKSLTYAFIIQQIRRSLSETFEDAVYIIGSHQTEPAEDLAKQVKAVFPDEGVAFLQGGIERSNLRGVKFAVGTYQQLAQEGTIALLKSWAGRRRVVFVLDEADLVVFKGKKEFIEDEVDEEGWHASWFRPLIEFGLFTENGHYRPNTKHYMLGASATLDRPDGIPLSTVWGPGNVFYHTPMASGIRQGLLVPIVGRVVEMKVPDGADLWQFRELTRVTSDGRIEIDQAKVVSAASSDYGVNTAIRTAHDHIIMQLGVGRRKSYALRKTIGWVTDREALEKHMRWQQELFALVEAIFHVHKGLHSPSGIRAETVIRQIKNYIENLNGLSRENRSFRSGEEVEEFGEELKRFLYSTEWRRVKSLFKKASGSLKRGRTDGALELFNALYKTLTVEARRVKGSPLTATAVWQDMELDSERKRIPKDPNRGKNRAIKHYPDKRWPNRFGDRQQTMWAVKDEEIDVVWSIGMLDRGFNFPMASHGVDNDPSKSRRRTVQKVGRVTRPPDGKNPRDHSLKPEALYSTLTPNLEVHLLDLDRWDLARLFGKQIDPEVPILRVHQESDPPDWKTPDKVQLDLKSGEMVHVIRVGANTAKAVTKYLQRYYADDFDVEVAAFDAGISTDELAHLMAAIRFPKENKLKQWLEAWGADQDTIRQIMGTYHSDLANMKTVYGTAWKIISRGQR